MKYFFEAFINDGNISFQLCKTNIRNSFFFVRTVKDKIGSVYIIFMTGLLLQETPLYIKHAEKRIGIIWHSGKTAQIY